MQTGFVLKGLKSFDVLGSEEVRNTLGRSLARHGGPARTYELWDKSGRRQNLLQEFI